MVGARAALAVLLLAACAAPPPDPPRTGRERDSALGASTVIPGATGVRGALDAADTAAARNRLRDSLAALP